MSFKIYKSEIFEPLYKKGQIDFSENFIINTESIGVFQSENHKKAHLAYLFNMNDKYFNEKTKHNLYFESENLKWSGETDRENLYDKYANILLQIPPDRCGFQRFEFNIGSKNKPSMAIFAEIIKYLETLDFYVEREYVKNLIYVLHCNQKGTFTHFHRLFHLPNDEE